MMRLRLVIALGAMLLLALAVWTKPAATLSTTSILVANADNSWLTVTTRSSELDTVVQSVQPRVATQYANATDKQTLLNIPTNLQTLVGAIVRQVIFQYANAGVRHDLVAVPAALQQQMGAVTARVWGEYANSSYPAKLVYPRALLNDTVAPVASDFGNSVSGTSAKITWNTNEFARCTVRYGTQPGNYTNTIENLLHFKQHEATLPAITIGAIYYVQITCTDQSDNAATSAEFSFGTDKIAPVISGANSIVSGNGVSITWQTDEPATTQVRYGTALGTYTQNATTSGFSTQHTAALANLADSKYYAQIISADQSGNQTVGTEFSFVIDTTAPQVSSITEPVLTGNNARIGWTTNEAATALIEFGTQAGVYTGSVTAPAGTGAQQFTLPGLAWGTTYYVRIRVEDGHGNVTTTIEFSFTTPRAVFLPLIRR